MVATLLVPTPLELIAAQVECELITLPTGAHVFRRGSEATAIHGLRKGLVELVGPHGERTCFRGGDLFSYRDLMEDAGFHGGDAVARTPVEILRLDRPRFLRLLRVHPTLAVQLLQLQHGRLREQRSSGSCCY